MQDQDMRGFAGPIDYETYGYYLPKPKDGVSILESYRSQFRDRVRADGSTPYPAEPGRYHVYLALGCPWAQRAAIVIELLGLADAISYSLVDDVRDGRGWAFRETSGPDPINNFSFLRQAYLRTDPDFEGPVTVPSIWDRVTGRIVNNDDDDVFWDLMTQFEAWAKTPLPLYPQAHRAEMDLLDAEIHETLNFGVYRTNFALDQVEYDCRVERAFATLDRLEGRLATRRYLFGGSVCETDIRLWVTLARFDAVYNPLFRVNLRRLVDYPHLWAYARDLYSQPAFAKLCDFDAFKATYYRVPQMNPSGIIPAGPLVDWRAPQSRARLDRTPTVEVA